MSARRLPLLLAASVAALVAGGGALAEPPEAEVARGSAATTALRERLPEAGVGVLGGRREAVHPAVRPFYERRAWAPAFAEPAVQRALLARLYEAPSDGLGRESVGVARAVAIARALDGARRDGRAEAIPALLADLEVALADAFLRYGDALLGRNVDPQRLYGAQWIPTRRPGAPADTLAAALLDPKPAAVAAALDRLAPAHPEYAALRDRLERLRRVLRAGWAPLRPPDTLAVGARSVWVPALRDRLVALGFAAPARVGDPYRFDSTLAAGLGRLQVSRGLDSTAAPDAPTMEALNRRPDDLATALALNLARWRWLPDDLGERHVLVNLPAYAIEVRERQGDATRTVLQMPAVIGMASAGSWTTPVLSDSIREIVFQPPWYVPPSIAAAVIYPAARADSGTTLTARGYETYHNGARVDPATLDWETVTPGELRFVQRPGPGNALGRVKFVMPNPYFILIHDTNKPWSFRSAARAFSHGCIHAGDPLALAQYVLGACGAMTPEEAEGAFRRGGSRAVAVTEPFPVHLLYFTAWPEPDGTIRYLPDVYGHDAALIAALGLDRAEEERADKAAGETKVKPDGGRSGAGSRT